LHTDLACRKAGATYSGLPDQENPPRAIPCSEPRTSVARTGSRLHSLRNHVCGEGSTPVVTNNEVIWSEAGFLGRLLWPRIDTIYIRSPTHVFRKLRASTYTVHASSTQLRVRRTVFCQEYVHGDEHYARRMKPVLSTWKGSDLAMYTRCFEPLHLRTLSSASTNASRDMISLNETSMHHFQYHAYRHTKATVALCRLPDTWHATVC
jgi:hypothetical protein